MMRRFPGIASGSRLVSVLCGILLFLQVTASYAALSCDPGMYSSIIGMEVVAVQCIPEGMNDSTGIYYRYRRYECIGGVVTKTSEGNNVLETPYAIAHHPSGMGSYYRHFRNKEGSYFLQVSTQYRGTIDGKSMSLSAYSGGGIYTDVFTRIIDSAGLPPVPDCKGSDFNKPPIEACAGSTVSMGTGRLSHSQEVFTLSGGDPLPLSVSLHYRSIPFAPSAIGNGWSHSYEATLQSGPSGSMIFWNEGERRVYSKYNSSYVAPKDDHSTLARNPDNSWTITELDGLKRNFDATYKLTSIVDRYNNSLTFTYTNDQLAAVTDANGRAVCFGYIGTKLETITDPKGNVHTLGYTGNNLTSVTPPGDKGHWNYSYNLSNGLLESKTDPAGHTSSYAYYPSDIRVQTVTDPQLKQRSYGSPSSKSVGKIPDCYHVLVVPLKTFNFLEKTGKEWSYTFDTLTKKVRSATDPYGKTTTYYYNSDSTLRAITIPYDGTTRYTTFYTYDGKGNLLTETDPVDISSLAIDPQTVDIASLKSLSPPIKPAVIYSYDTANYYQIKTITDNRGTTPLTTTFDRYTEPDGEGGNWLVTRTTAPGETAGATLISYQRQNGNGTLASVTDAGGKTTSFTYYPVNPTDYTSGMLNTVTTPDRVKLTFTAYDENGNPTEYKLTDADSNDIPAKTTLEYSALNRITSILKESTAGPISFPPNLTRYGYDNNGNVDSVTDAENHETQYQYTYDRQQNRSQTP